MLYIGKKGKHDFRPRTPITFKWKPKKLTCKVKFGEGSDYNMLPDTDQWDYSKLEGFSFTPVRNNYKAVMFAWCYDPDKKKYRVVGYINDKGPHKRTPYIEVDEGQEITLVAEFHRKRVKFNLNGTTHELSTKFKFRLAKRIGMWFGGNKPCPQDMVIWSTFKVN